MSEKNNIFENDLLMRAILDGGQEEVPARVWDGISDELDKAARKTVVLRWRRAFAGVAAVAAAVASVFVMTGPESADIVPAAVHGDMIAVVESEAVDGGNKTDIQTADITSPAVETRLMAYVPKNAASVQKTMTAAVPAIEETAPEQNITADEELLSEDRKEVSATPTNPKTESGNIEPKEYFPTVWEDETPARKIRTSVVVSGITGASGSSQNNTSAGINKAPAVILTPTETGIKEKNSPSRYGLPVSAGAGIKIEFTPRWSLGVGLNYTYLSRTFEGTYTHVNELGLADIPVTSDIRNSQHYIGIPVNAYYNILGSKHVNLYAYAGGAVEKCVSNKYHVLSNSVIHKEPAKGVQFSTNIGLGAEFMLGEHLGLYLDPSIRYYFDCNQPKNIRTEQPLMLGFELGFRFRL